jgi:hypothetical protein
VADVAQLGLFAAWTRFGIWAMAYQVSLIFFSVCWHIHVHLNETNSALVVDEVYHVPQAQRYCAGNFSYVSLIKPLFDDLIGNFSRMTCTMIALI